MASINIVAPGAPIDIPAGTVVTVEASPAGAGSYLWEFLDKPEGSAAAFLDPAAESTTFLADVEGSYFLRLTVDGTDVAQAIAAVPFITPLGPVRIPAAGETFEVDALKGWARALQKALKLATITANQLAGKLPWKTSVRASSNANEVLSGPAPLTVDDVVLADGDRVLLRGQASLPENGVYGYAESAGTYTLTRATDADDTDELQGMVVVVREGTSWADKAYLQVMDDVDVGVDDQVFAELGASGPGVANVYEVATEGGLTGLTGASRGDVARVQANGEWYILKTDPPTIALNWERFTIRNNLEAAAAPTLVDDSTLGYKPGSRWLDTVAKQHYVCVDATAGAAIWQPAAGGVLVPTGLAELVDTGTAKVLRWTIGADIYEVELGLAGTTLPAEWDAGFEAAEGW